MDEGTQRLLLQETQRFYATCAESFAATRGRPWRGWDLVLNAVGPRLQAACRAGRPLRILDLGCGTFRFERWLGGAVTSPWEALGVDTCPTLGEQRPAGCELLVADLSNWEPPVSLHGAFDLAVSFGLLHHLPGPARSRVLSVLATCAAPGGIVAASFWQLSKDVRLARKARQATGAFLSAHPEARLELGDHLLGWQESEGVFRYCHDFSDQEVRTLASSDARLSEVSCYDADRSNRYVIWRR